MSNNLRTAKQEEILNKLSETFGINPDRILFINPRDQNDPWIPSDELESIARQTEGCKQISVGYDKYISETKQVIFYGDGRDPIRDGLYSSGRGDDRRKTGWN